MPRTKVARQKKKSAVDEDSDFSTLMKELDLTKENVFSRLQEKYEEAKRNYINYCDEKLVDVPVKIRARTLAELSAGHNSTTYMSSTRTASVLESSKQSRTVAKLRKRSLSLVEDEGYLTAESSNGTSGGHSSRGRSAMKSVVKSNRVSRSLSRSKLQKSVPVHSSYKTPLNKNTAPTNFGTVTPKVNPNIPQVVLRRPKQGEIALSMQGSPLMVSNVVADFTANVNIPLQDGRLIAIQPQRGLRLSQLPCLDLDTRRQIEALRDNLNKVCAYAAGIKK